MQVLSQYLHYSIDQSFQGVNRIFVFVFVIKEEKETILDFSEGTVRL